MTDNVIVVTAKGPPGPAGPAGPPSIGSHRYVVDDEAALAGLLDTVDGDSVFVLTHRSEWIVNVNGATPIAADAHRRIARTEGGTFDRTTYSDPAWRLEISDIYIDAANVTGIADDENLAWFDSPQSGNARAPIRTWREFSRRVGTMNRWTAAAGGDNRITIHVLSDLNGSDLNDLCELQIYADVQTFVVLKGEASTIYVSANLALGDGYTPHNPTSPAPGGTAAQVKVVGQNWSAYIGFLLNFPQSGAVATILKDLGGGVARISPPVITNKDTDQLLPTPYLPSAGELVEVKLWCGMNVGAWRFRFAGTSDSSRGLLKVQNLTFVVNTQSALWGPEAETGSAYAMVEFYECKTTRVILHKDNSVWSGCQIAAGYQAAHGEFGGGVVGCGIVPQDNRPHIFISGKNSHALNRGVFDFDTTLQGCFLLVMGPTQIGAISVWDAPATGNNPAGHGICVGQSQNMLVPAGLALTGGVAIFGSGNAGRGIHVNPGSHVTYEGGVPNITGVAGDFGLGNGATGWYFDGTTNPPNYQPQNGIACSWVNLAATNPGGFNHQAHDPRTNAHLVRVTAF